MQLVKTQSPEERELELKHAELEQELVEQELDLSTLQPAGQWIVSPTSWSTITSSPAVCFQDADGDLRD